MLLAIIILNRIEVLDDFLLELGNHGIKGATILKSEGMARVLSERSDTPLMSTLRVMLNADNEENRTILTVISEKQFKTVSEVARDVIGDLNGPDTAVIFTIPVSHTEGMTISNTN